MKKIATPYLCLVALVLWACIGFTYPRGTTQPSPLYHTQVLAAEKMLESIEHIKSMRYSLGLDINDDDWHQTGLIGLPFTGITTTLGPLEAKRTTSSHDMAALVVLMLDQAGVKSGDRVGAVFSGSFPGLNLAVLCATEAMGVELAYITSIGSSTYGANQPELPFPSMAISLVDHGILSQYPVATSLGGASDCGLDMDPELLAQMTNLLSSLPFPFLYEPDFAQNIQLREELLGKIDCFLGVGGNVTSSGQGWNQVDYGVVMPYAGYPILETSGMLARYNARGLSVIHLLNVKDLVATYGLPYDPDTLPEVGQSSHYYVVNYPKHIPLLGISSSFLFLLIGKKRYKMTRKYDFVS